MNNTIEQYQVGKTSQVWDKTQDLLDCCGSMSYTDWEKNSVFANTSSVPDSCCKDHKENCGKGALAESNPVNIYHEGCADQMIAWANRNIVIIGVVALVLAFIQIVGIIIACCLAAAIRKDYSPM
jgi:hypothetical protein